MKLEDFENVEYALNYLRINHDYVTTREILIEFVQEDIANNDYDLTLPIHILEAISLITTDYFVYDYNMGTHETPRPIASWDNELINELLSEVDDD